MLDSFNARTLLECGGQRYHIASLKRLEPRFDVTRLPWCLRILLENMLRHEDGRQVSKSDLEALLSWQGRPTLEEVPFSPARVLLQDFTGVPAVVDLAAMRDAVVELGEDPKRVNPLVPVDLVIDHSVQVDSYARKESLDLNTRLEFRRNRERYAFLRWGQRAFSDLRVVPPGAGIVHQVNLEYLADVVMRVERDGQRWAVPDTLVGTDSHTTMINGLGVLGWGVGGIEAEAAMLGQALTMPLPEVVGVRLHGRLAAGSTATDLVLTVTELLRNHGVVGRFVEFFGAGLNHLPLPDRATIANMAPEYGATCGLFPIDSETLRYLRLTGREASSLELIERYAREQRLFRDPEAPDPIYTEELELDLGRIVASIAGPKRPQDRIPLTQAKANVQESLHLLAQQRSGAASEDFGMARFQDEGGDTAIAAEEAQHVGAVRVDYEGERFLLRDGAVVVAAITSCTNTSNPAVMVAAGLLAREARRRGLHRKPWVKTSLAPGSRVVVDYLQRAGLMQDLEAIGFHVVGFGCTTCIGNSGPLAEPIHDAISDGELITAAVLSGNRNFEGRIHPQVRLNYLASPPLVVAYALTGRVDHDWESEPLGEDDSGSAVFLADLWPSAESVQAVIDSALNEEMYRDRYKSVFDGDDNWNGLGETEGVRYPWAEESTYIRKPPFLNGMDRQPGESIVFRDARVLALLGDSVTTDHISPAGAIPVDSPAGRYLVDQGVEASDFNSYGARRGNHEVMLRGTFANIRLRNALAPGTEGGWTRHQPSGDQTTIFEAAQRYLEEDCPLLVIAGAEYGTGSSRDWAAKGTRLLGVAAVLASSFERIHRSNLVGMGVLPLQFQQGETADSLGLDGTETYSLEELKPGSTRAKLRIGGSADAAERLVEVVVRVDTPMEWEYYRHGGILPFTVRTLADG